MYYFMALRHIPNYTIALLGILDNFGGREVGGGDPLHDEMGKVEVICSVAGIFVAITGGSKAGIAAVVGGEGVPDRVEFPDVTWTAVIDVGNLRLLLEGDVGLALVDRCLISSTGDGKGLVDCQSFVSDLIKVCPHERSPRAATELSKHELSELVGGNGGLATIMAESIHELSKLLSISIAVLVGEIPPSDGWLLLRAKIVVISDRNPSHVLSIVDAHSIRTSAGRAFADTQYALRNEVVHVHTVGLDHVVTILTVVLLLVADAGWAPALLGDLLTIVNMM